MRLVLALPVAAAFMLAACGQKSADQPKTVEEVKQEAAKIVGPQPGQYRSTVKVLDFDIPGAPPQMADHMKQMMSGQQAQTHEYCLTPEETKGGFEEMVKKSQQGNCMFDNFNATAGTIDAKMTCKMQEGITSTMSMKGKMTPTSMVMDMEMDQMQAAIPGGKMHMKMQVTNERIGDCPAGNAAESAK